MGNGVAYWAVGAMIKPDCQVMLDPYISGVFMQCVARERQYSDSAQACHRRFTGGVVLTVLPELSICSLRLLTRTY